MDLKYYELISKAIINNSYKISDYIDKYLAKADEDLEKTLKSEGFAESKKTVSIINSLEEDVTEVLKEQTDCLIETLKSSENDEADNNELHSRIASMLAADGIANDIEELAVDMYENEVLKLSDIYIKESDGDMVVSSLRERTYSWFEQWGARLGELTQITTHSQITSLIDKAIESGESIADLTGKIQEGGWRTEYYQARRFALTEVLRAHSVAREEAIQQSPACDRKEWRHTGEYKIEPRQNHVDMDGQIVLKTEPFELKGIDGNIYYPMYPRDSILPASESVNCHCTHIPIVNDDILGMSYEERKQLQEEYLNEDHEKWLKELDNENKSKAGIKVNENENSKSRYDNKVSVIDRKQIASSGYRNRYNSIPETKKVQRRVASSAKKMLRHRSGTNYEDLAYIDSKTGNIMLRDNYNVSKQVIPSRAMKKMLKDAEDYSIIAIHNHPTSSVPSVNDLYSARDRKYKYGIVACHNGDIYKYRVSAKINESMADGGLDMLERVKYISDKEERLKMLKRALTILKESGVEMEVL